MGWLRTLLISLAIALDCMLVLVAIANCNKEQSNAMILGSVVLGFAGALNIVIILALQ